MFFLTKIENARMNVPEPELLEVAASTAVTDGQALILSSGKLASCPATTKPQFIAGKDLKASDTDRIIPVFRITADMVFAAPVSVAPTSLVPGAKVTIASDALGVTATTASGVATIVNLNGAVAADDAVLVRFV